MMKKMEYYFQKEVSQTTKKEIAPGILLKPAMLHFNVKEGGQEVSDAVERRMTESAKTVIR